MIEQRVEVTSDKSYYPQYKWLFWWRYYKIKQTVCSHGIWKEERNVKVVFPYEEQAIAFLDRQYSNRTANQVTAWITWKPKQ